MRRTFTAAEKQRYVAEQKASGETPWRFAHRAGITPTSLYRWMSKPEESKPPKFGRLLPERGSSRAKVVVAGSITVQVGAARVAVEPGFDAALLRAVVDALSGRAAS